MENVNDVNAVCSVIKFSFLSLSLSLSLPSPCSFGKMPLFCHYRRNIHLCRVRVRVFVMNINFTKDTDIKSTQDKRYAYAMYDIAPSIILD